MMDSERFANLSPEEKRVLLESILQKKSSRPRYFPLSFAQQRLWFLDQMEPGNAFYNVPAVLQLVGSLDIVALERSINEIVQRHEALRTAFTVLDGQPTQAIMSSLTVPLSVLDLREFSSAEQESRASAYIAQEALRPFDLSALPLIRAFLLSMEEEKSIFLLVMHHIISDGWSMDVLLQELSTLYTAFSSGQPSPLARLPIQYADFAAWQQKWLQGERLERLLAYWREQLADLSTLHMPTDRPRPEVQSYRGATYAVPFSKELIDDLKRISQQESVSLFMTLLATFVALLHRYSGQDDISIGSGVANRTRKEIEGLIGFFVNTLVLRTNVAGNPSFRELLKRVRDVALGAYAHEDLPFEKLVEELQPERDLGRQPLFQIMFILHSYEMPTLKLGSSTLTPVPFDSGTAKFDLNFSLLDTGNELMVSVEYSTDLFERETIVRLVKHWQRFLESAIADVTQPVDQLLFLTEAESDQILREWQPLPVADSPCPGVV
ncbi:MAG TPA: condensation domain-containing protein, partial [Ktedonobacteraceae bacterium]|nr:condensation domain-containing protein [Ktedonobacteraceae bacterium]